MAAIAPRTTFPEIGVCVVTWPSVTAADTFAAATVGSRYTDRMVSVQGTFDSSTVLIKGSVDGTNYATQTTTAGSASYAAAGQHALLESSPYLQPTHSGGGGSTSVTVTVRMAAVR